MKLTNKNVGDSISYPTYSIKYLNNFERMLKERLMRGCLTSLSVADI